MRKPILIVEDDSSVRETLREVLEAEGYTVAEAANGREALDYLRVHGEPCLVLLDLMMPVMSGFDFLEVVKGDPSLAHATILIVSAAAGEKVEEARRASTAVGALMKPVQLEPLLEAVEHFC